MPSGNTESVGLSQAGLLTPLRNDTLNNLQLNAGVFIKNLVLTGTGAPTDATSLRTLISNIISGTNTTAGTLLGATRGGGTFTVTRDMRTPEIDGIRYRWKGGNFVDSVDAYLSTTLVETTKENFVDLLGATQTHESDSNIYKLTMSTEIPSAAYLTNVCWVGETSGGKLVLIVLKNAINTADFSLTFADKNEGTLAVEFHACQANVSDYNTAPFEVYFFTVSTSGTTSNP